MRVTLPANIAKYVDSVNAHDVDGFTSCFREDAVVNDAGRTFNGRTAIEHWFRSDILEPLVTMEVLDVSEGDADQDVVVTARVDGNFDRTGLPDPVVLVHRYQLVDDRIGRLNIRLAD